MNMVLLLRKIKVLVSTLKYQKKNIKKINSLCFLCSFFFVIAFLVRLYYYLNIYASPFILFSSNSSNKFIIVSANFLLSINAILVDEYTLENAVFSSIGSKNI